ncbi:MAG: DeoR/GlpR transcriptional regulator [Clostridia bacterium]|nr:DeoR/GlpR transcriptional regulator [Clostridia bacterium]
MFSEERHRIILEHLQEAGRVSTAWIQRHFQVGYSTAMRDLDALAEQGLVKRTHGGAIIALEKPQSNIGAGRPAGMTCVDMEEVYPAYLAIAQKAVEMLQPGDTVFLSAATVCTLMIRNLPEGMRLRVCVNSILLAEELRQKPNITVVPLGGEMDERGNVWDVFAQDMLARMRFDKCFITAASLSADFGLSIQKPGYGPFVTRVMDSAGQVIGLFPGEKVGRTSVYQSAPAARLDLLITDSTIPEEEYTALTKLGIEIVTASLPEELSASTAEQSPAGEDETSGTKS